MTLINVNNEELPGVQSLRTRVKGKEMFREEIYVNGKPIGAVVYLAIQRKVGGSVYGWIPEGMTRNRKLTRKAAAIKLLMETKKGAKR